MHLGTSMHACMQVQKYRHPLARKAEAGSLRAEASIASGI
jgi:hypothetical protein